MNIWTRIVAAALCVGAGAALPGQQRVDRVAREVPSGDYFLALRDYHDGEFARAAQDFRQATTRGLNTALDNVCYHAMAGECFYQLGNLDAAREHFRQSLGALMPVAGWMLQMQYNPSDLRPAPGPVRPTINWGAKSRRTGRALVAERLPLLIPSAALVQDGNSNIGLLPTATTIMIRMPELVRCIALAQRRRMELLGPVCPHVPLSGDLVAMFATPLAPPNHWIQSWVRLQLGLAHAAHGDTVDAVRELQSSLLTASMDHPLTCVALLELGKLARASGQLEPAANYFYEAAVSAAEYHQYGEMAEAFELLVKTNLMRGDKTVLAALPGAIAWGHQTSRLLEGSLSATLAENLAGAGRSREAAAAIQQAWRGLRPQFARQPSRLAARLQFATALADYQAGGGRAADPALAEALGFMRVGSLWRYHAAFAESAYRQGAIGSRVAFDLFTTLLRDPADDDWKWDPGEALAVLMLPNEAAMEQWFLLALERKEPERALEIIDLARRRRFFASLPLGGRMLSLRWVLQAPEALLSDHARGQRQAIRNAYPALTQLEQQADQLRQQLDAEALNETDGPKLKQQQQLLASLAKVAGQEEQFLSALALDRIAADLVFPPQADVNRIRERLPEGHAVLMYVAAPGKLLGFAITRENYGSWEIEEPEQILKELQSLLQQMGCRNRVAPLRPSDLNSPNWKPAAEQLGRRLLPQFPATDSGRQRRQEWEQIEELVIVPDGVLWYVPFGVLPASPGDDRFLMHRKRIRTAPLLSLVTPSSAPRGIQQRTALIQGRVTPKDDEQWVANEARRLSGMIGPVQVLERLPGPSALLADRCEQLVVWADLVDSEKPSHQWAPMGLDRGRPDNSLADWMKLPWGAPRTMVLPGFHSQAESGAKSGDGQELFLASCGLLASGSRSVVLSRWAVGGESSRRLVREFLVGVAQMGAASSWQRSVHLLWNSQLDPTQEPRAGAAEDPMRASHPFFWAGYLLIDLD